MSSTGKRPAQTSPHSSVQSNRPSTWSQIVLSAGLITSGFTLSQISWSAPLSSHAPLPLMLAKHYQQQDNIESYWVSEKLDGVRAYWDGTTLRTRQGNPINAPLSMLNALPNTALDGELWLGRGRFAEVSGLVRQQQPDEEAWAEIQYRIFDIPNQIAPFDHRVEAIKTLCRQLNLPWLQPVGQYRIPDQAALQAHLEALTDAGAEGLMLHRGSALYQSGRSDDLLKMKLYEDAEAVVLGYTKGQGQFTGMMGALKVRLADGRTMKIGSGFSHHERQTPPPIGSIITYRYNGKTATGLPRFARFMRIRDDIGAMELK